MGKVKIVAAKEKLWKKVEETIEKTVIHQRQMELVPNRWDFAVFGPSADGKKAVLRVGVAEQSLIHKAPTYIATVGDPDRVGTSGMISIEELAGGDVSDELKGLEVYHVSPLRPISINRKVEAESIGKMRDEVLEELEGRNVAIIETPDETAWSVSVLRYLNECDEMFPDPVMSIIRSKMTDTEIDFRRPHGGLLH